MNTPSASPAEPARKVLVWDAPVRVFHWLLVICFGVAWITAESERWRLVHITCGYTVAGLVAFRLVWGFIGSSHARFANFVRGPGAVLRYLRSLVQGRPEHHVGHNPAGALAIVALLALAAGVTLTGWLGERELVGEWIGEWHEGLAAAMLTIVVVHVAAVVASSWLHKENLVRAMFTGRKAGSAAEAIRSPRRLAGAALLATVLGFWTVQWFAPPVPTGDAQASAHRGHQGEREQDDD